MQEIKLNIKGRSLRIISGSTLIVGSGAAGWNAAESLSRLGQKDVILVSDQLNAGTSRNSGSDKQTYYKLSLASDSRDSIREMADDLFKGGSVDGDVAYCEAAGSVRAFMRLVELDVAFPTNEWGEFVGYKTDHDPRQRATSSGPLTSHDMTIALESSVRQRGDVTIMDGQLVFDLITEGQTIKGAIALDLAEGGETYADAALSLFLVNNVILATGGPAAAYKDVVFPPSQHGMLGMALRAGAVAQNLQEWQYGLASIKFRWNVSGTYQQVLPRYVSVDSEGNTYEFLDDFLSISDKLEYTFLKGYQWPFDVNKIKGSSIIDLLVYYQTRVLGRRVYMDFMHNPSSLEPDFSNVPLVAKSYLENSSALQATPFLRLWHMNPAAIELYRAHNIDLATEMLEVSVCAQHLNGGLSVDRNWQTSIEGLYCVGEAAGTFGVYRPGGSALNSGQVGSYRAAEAIAYSKRESALERNKAMLQEIERRGFAALMSDDVTDTVLASVTLLDLWEKDERAHARSYRRTMSDSAAHIRILSEIESILQELAEVSDDARVAGGLRLSFIERDQRFFQRALLESIAYSAECFGSRGSSLIFTNEPNYERISQNDENIWDSIPEKTEGRSQVLTCRFDRIEECFKLETRNVRPIPESNVWFESVWKQYREYRDIQ